MTLCIGKPIIQLLARYGAWRSENGEAVIAADELFHNDPYAEIERLRAALHEQGGSVTRLLDDLDAAQTEIERLRAALKNIAGITEPDHPAHALHRCRETARLALEGISFEAASHTAG